MICKICGKEVLHLSPYQRARGLCDSCIVDIKEKEKKTFTWYTKHFLKIEKSSGKYIIPGEDFTQDKYGLQKIFINGISDIVELEFYFGRSFIHRPTLKFSLKNVENYKEVFLNLIRASNKKEITISGRCYEVKEIYEKIK